MQGRKLALMVCVAASCAGCVTETKDVPPGQMGNLKGVTIKPEEPCTRTPQPHSLVAMGQFREEQAGNDKLGVAQQNALREEARKAYQRALEIDPKNVEAHLALANFYARQEDFDHAIAQYQRGLQANPKSTQLWSQEGVCYAHKKDYPHALQSLAKAHELDPENRDLAVNYGLLLAHLGRPQEAVPVLTKVMSKADANTFVARMLQHNNQPEQARQYVQAALREQPTHRLALAMQEQMNNPTRQQVPTLTFAPGSDQALQPAGYHGQ
jgi:tetratricopeptide (TPR) repeat protein